MRAKCKYITDSINPITVGSSDHSQTFGLHSESVTNLQIDLEWKWMTRAKHVQWTGGLREHLAAQLKVLNVEIIPVPFRQRPGRKQQLRNALLRLHKREHDEVTPEGKTMGDVA